MPCTTEEPLTRTTWYHPVVFRRLKLLRHPLTGHIVAAEVKLRSLHKHNFVRLAFFGLSPQQIGGNSPNPTKRSRISSRNDPILTPTPKESLCAIRTFLLFYFFSPIPLIIFDLLFIRFGVTKQAISPPYCGSCLAFFSLREDFGLDGGVLFNVVAVVM